MVDDIRVRDNERCQRDRPSIHVEDGRKVIFSHQISDQKMRVRSSWQLPCDFSDGNEMSEYRVMGWTRLHIVNNLMGTKEAGGIVGSQKAVLDR